MDNLNNSQLPPVPQKKSAVKWLIGLLVLLLIVAGGVYKLKTKKAAVVLKPVVQEQKAPKPTKVPLNVIPPPAGFPTDLPLDSARQAFNATTTIMSNRQFYEVAYLSGKTMEQTLQDFKAYFSAHGIEPKAAINNSGNESIGGTLPDGSVLTVNLLQRNSQLQVDLNYLFPER